MVFSTTRLPYSDQSRAMHTNATTHWLGFYLVGERHGHTERRAGVEIILIEPIEYRIGLGNCHGGEIDGQKKTKPALRGLLGVELFTFLPVSEPDRRASLQRPQPQLTTALIRAFSHDVVEQFANQQAFDSLARLKLIGECRPKAGNVWD